jgi:peptidoglycan lytic transglycosylase G
MRAVLRLFGFLILLVAGLAGAAAYWAYWEFDAPGPTTTETTVVIERGVGVRDIAATLHDAGVIGEPLIFLAGVEVFGKGRPLKAGEYLFPARLSMHQVMQQMIDGTTVVHRLTVPEGLTAAEIVALVASATDLAGDLPKDLPADGSLLPETYFYSRGDTRQDLLARMKKGMDDRLAELWQARDPAAPLKTPAEAVTLASIVEKETGVAAERPHVAAVFYNRLAQGMPLQSDPTVIYALTAGKGPLNRALSHADLQTASPYNTYVNMGLPPGPIANPGRASLEAVLHPATSKDLYFVADGTGGHVFAETLDEHNKNVARWRQLQKQQAGDAKGQSAD